MNRFYLAFPELGFMTSYICVTNDLVVEQFADDFVALPIPKFIAWRSHRHFKQNIAPKEMPTFVYTSYTGPRFATDVRGRVWEGATVTNLALQLAYHMGIEKENSYAMIDLGSYYKEQEDYDNMEKYYLMAIAKGNNTAMLDLGNYYKAHDDYDNMKKYYLMAIENGDTYAMLDLGNYYKA